MPTAQEFDEFYVSTRHALILQTFALTGDLSASRAAVRDSYIAARHHWDKVGKDPDPMGWVRPKAWARAQRRHSISPWHRERHIDEDQTATLEALHQLRDGPRRTLVLHVLTELSLEQIGREIGLPIARVTEHLHAATELVTEVLDCTPEEITARLTGLGPAVDTVKLPRPSIVRRNGLRRRRNFAVAGSVGIAAIVVAAGGFVAVGSPADPPSNAGLRDVSKIAKGKEGSLLTETQIVALAPGQAWGKGVTSQNADQNSSGLNTTCQQERFADKEGDGALVRTFTNESGPKRKLVQAVEISRSLMEAETAYKVTRSWYAGCKASRIQLLRAYDISQVGNQAQVLLLAGSQKTDPSFAVGLARSGRLTVSVVLETKVDSQVPIRTITAALATSVRNLCASNASGDCVGQVISTQTAPPLSGDAEGMLAGVDLPPISTVKATWNGAPPIPATVNSAATVCDQADFMKSGATNPMTRGFLLSNDNAPKLFGVTETVGKFPSARAATRFVERITSRMQSCEERVLSSTIETQVIKNRTATSPGYAYWRLVNQTQNRAEVSYWMGVSRVGNKVAQITMLPVGRYDVSSSVFSDLVVRSRDRLAELA